MAGLLYYTLLVYLFGNLALKAIIELTDLQVRGAGQEGVGASMMQGGKQGGTTESCGSCPTSPKMKER
jgi:hypothetical protein